MVVFTNKSCPNPRFIPFDDIQRKKQSRDMPKGTQKTSKITFHPSKLTMNALFVPRSTQN